MKILLVEDSSRLRKSIQAGLTQLGFITDSTGDGKEGLAFALSYDYDVIVLDLMLPSLGGYEIIKLLREKGRQSNILILSARDLVDDRVKALNLGADDYLCKPFAFDELIARINTLVRRGNSLKSTEITLGKARLDLLLRQLIVDGVPLSLTPLEYSIIEQLALKRGRVLTYDQLINHVYDGEAETSQNTLEVHVSGTRRKLKAVGITDLIKTRRSIGYYIEKS